MIGTISIKCNAAHPEIALPTIYTHADSPSSIRIIDVPKKIGEWQITSVYVNVIYPDGTTLNKQCVLTGGAWVATIEGNDTVGETKNGYTVLADGTDELGNDVVGYVLGVGDVKVIQSNPSVDPEEQYTLMRLYEQEPTELKDGATYVDDGHLAVYADGDVVKCANESELPDMDNYYTKSEVDGELEAKADESELQNYYTKSEVDSQISSKADKTKLVKEYYPVLSDSWTGAGYTFNYAGKYMSTDVEQWLPTTYSPEGWSLRFINEEYGWVLAGPISTQITGVGIDATTLRFKNSEYDYTFTRNMTNYTEEPYDVVYADTTEQMYTKAEVDAIIQKLKDDNHLV